MWFYFAALSALLNSFGILARKTHGSLAHPLELCWWTLLFGLPLGIGLLLTSNSPYYTDLGFLVPASLSATIGIFSSSLSFYAYQKGDISAVAPLANLLPIAMIPVSFFMLGTIPNVWGFAGIVLIVCGVYYSSLGKASLGHPIKQLWRSPASRAMLGVIVLWAIGTNLDKIAMEHATPAFTLAYRQVVSLAVLSGILLLHPQRHRFRRGEKVLHRWGWHIMAIAVFATLAVYFQLLAVQLIDPAYVMAVKRIDILFTIILAHFIFKEKHVLRRFEGSVVAIIGVIIIYISA